MKTSSEILKESQAFLISIFENLPDMIFVKDAKELRFITLNKAGENILGYTKEELIGKNDYDFFTKERAEQFTKKDRAVLDNKKFLEIPEETIKSKNKGERILHTKKIPILNSKGVPIFLLGISEDITEKKQALQIANQKSEDLKKMNGFMIGRELKMIELKKEILRLEAELYKKKKY